MMVRLINFLAEQAAYAAFGVLALGLYCITVY